jgi:hypothetical protein
MDYSLLTEQQIQKRFDSLPKEIKNVLDSKNDIEIVRQICRNHYLDEERTLMVEQLTGLVLLGFVLPDELSREISKNLNLNIKHSADIAAEIDRKIFAPIRSDLEKVYKPLSSGTLSEEKEVLDLRKTETEKEISEEPKKETVFEEPKVISLEEKKEEIKTEEVKPIEVAEEKIQPQITQSPITELPHEGPVIIHKEDEIKPIAETKKSLGGLFGFLRKSKEERISPVKAQVEIGLVEADKRGFQDMIEADLRGKAKDESSPKIRVVHYTEAPTPVNPFEKTKEEVKLAEADKLGMTQILETEEQRKVGTEPSMINIAKPLENLPAEFPKNKENKTEEKPLAEEAKPSKIESILDLRKAVEEAKSFSEKPPASPAKSEPPVVSKSEPEEKIIDLSSFK